MKYTAAYRATLLYKKTKELETYTNDYEEADKTRKKDLGEFAKIDTDLHKKRKRVEKAKKDLVEFVAKNYLNMDEYDLGRTE